MKRKLNKLSGKHENDRHDRQMKKSNIFSVSSSDIFNKKKETS